jgi:calcium permeable stress-gated cation channel
VKELPKLIEQYEKAVRDLESVLSKYLKNPDRLPANRPMCRPQRMFPGHRPGAKVDAIDYLTNRIRELEMKIKDVRETVNKRNAMPYGFASWDHIEEAHSVAFAAKKKHPQHTIIQLAPRPNDIIWDNLPLTPKVRKWKKLTNIFWVTILTVIWIAPNALIAIFLSDLSNLGLVWRTFQTSLEQHRKLWVAVQGIASPAILSTVYLILPTIFRRLAIRAGDSTKTARERHVVHQLYAFFVFNNLVVFSIFSAVWSFITTVINTKNSNHNVWDSIKEGEFFIKIMTALCQISPFWVTWVLQRNLGAAIDIAQLWTLFWVWFARTFLSPTPRQYIAWTAPPPFDYAS